MAAPRIRVIRNGVVTLDINDRVARLLGIYFLSAGASGSVVNDGILTGEPFVSAHMVGTGASGFGGENTAPPTISFSGNAMFYTIGLADHRLMLWVH